MGIEIMDVTDNYYDDLLARFDPKNIDIDRLRQLHVLYDEDEFGQFSIIY